MTLSINTSCLKKREHFGCYKTKLKLKWLLFLMQMWTSSGTLL